MAKIIIVNSDQIKLSMERFKALLERDQAEQDRLRQLQQRAHSGDPSSSITAPSPESDSEAQT